jgi:hypothetical protein
MATCIVYFRRHWSQKRPLIPNLHRQTLSNSYTDTQGRDHKGALVIWSTAFCGGAVKHTQTSVVHVLAYAVQKRRPVRQEQIRSHTYKRKTLFGSCTWYDLFHKHHKIFCFTTSASRGRGMTPLCKLLQVGEGWRAPVRPSLSATLKLILASQARGAQGLLRERTEETSSASWGSGWVRADGNLLIEDCFEVCGKAMHGGGKLFGI